MKSILNFFLLLAIMTISYNGEAIDANGYYVNLKNDTIKARFKIPYYPNISIDLNYRKLQNGIEVYVDKKEKQELLATDILAYSFHYTNEDFETDTINYVVKKNTLKLGRNDFFQYDSLIFLRQLIKGKLNLYIYYSIAYTGGMTPVGAEHETNILEKNKEQLYAYNLFKFKTDISEYLSDCTAVVKQIEEKKYKSKHIITIVEEYNKLCGQ